MKMKIYAKMNKPEKCALSGKMSPDVIAFFTETGEPVCPETALEQGFTIEPDEYKLFNEAVSHWLEMIEKNRRIVVDYPFDFAGRPLSNELTL